MLRAALIAAVSWIVLGIAFAQQSGPPPAQQPFKATLKTGAWKLDKELFSPDDCVKLAEADLRQLSTQLTAEELYDVRYLALYNFPAEMRNDVWAVTSLLINSFNSVSAEIGPETRPVFVDANKILLRVHLSTYGIKRSVWDSLGQKDPYFHQRINVNKVVTEKKEVVVKETALKKVDRTASFTFIGGSDATIRIRQTPGSRVFIHQGDMGVKSDSYRTFGTGFMQTERSTYRFKITHNSRTATYDVPVRRGYRTDIDLRLIVEEVQKVKVLEARLKDPKVEVAAAAWLSTEQISYLIKTTQSTSPILRADWWVSNASRPENYYAFLNITSIEDYLNLVAFDKRAFRKEAKATIAESGLFAQKVANNNRILARVPSFNGYVWQTFDFAESVGEKNVINNFLLLKSDGKTPVKRDAGEYIASLYNGLQVYALVNGEDKLVNAGGIQFVSDSNFADHEVINGRSCIACHAGGINQFESEFQEQVGRAPDKASLNIFDKDPKKAAAIYLDIRRKFGSPNFQEIVQDDCAIYNRAVVKATGIKAESVGLLFKTLWIGYNEKSVDLIKACYESGLTEEDLKKVLALKIEGRSNPVLVRLLRQPPRPIRRDHWEEAFPELMLLTATLPRKEK